LEQEKGLDSFLFRFDILTQAENLFNCNPPPPQVCWILVEGGAMYLEKYFFLAVFTNVLALYS
jgi:hypothetical protein